MAELDPLELQGRMDLRGFVRLPGEGVADVRAGPAADPDVPEILRQAVPDEPGHGFEVLEPRGGEHVEGRPSLQSRRRGPGDLDEPRDGGREARNGNPSRLHLPDAVGFDEQRRDGSLGPARRDPRGKEGGPKIDGRRRARIDRSGRPEPSFRGIALVPAGRPGGGAPEKEGPCASAGTGGRELEPGVLELERVRRHRGRDSGPPDLEPPDEGHQVRELPEESLDIDRLGARGLLLVADVEAVDGDPLEGGPLAAEEPAQAPVRFKAGQADVHLLIGVLPPDGEGVRRDPQGEQAVIQPPDADRHPRRFRELRLEDVPDEGLVEEDEKGRGDDGEAQGPEEDPRCLERSSQSFSHPASFRL